MTGEAGGGGGQHRSQEAGGEPRTLSPGAPTPGLGSRSPTAGLGIQSTGRPPGAVGNVSEHFPAHGARPQRAWSLHPAHQSTSGRSQWAPEALVTVRRVSWAGGVTWR